MKTHAYHMHVSTSRSVHPLEVLLWASCAKDSFNERAHDAATAVHALMSGVPLIVMLFIQVNQTPICSNPTTMHRHSANVDLQTCALLTNVPSANSNLGHSFIQYLFLCVRVLCVCVYKDDLRHPRTARVSNEGHHIACGHVHHNTYKFRT